MEELEVIVQRMIDAGESEQNIKAVIQEYNAGKTNGAAAKGATATPKTGQAPESSGLGLEDSSSGLNIEDFLVTIDDLKDSETNVVTNLNDKLSRLGLSSYTTTNIGSTDAIKIRKSGDKVASDYMSEALDVIGLGDFVMPSGTLLDVFDSSKVGSDKSDEELKESADKLNEYIRENANLSYTKEAKNKFGEKYKKEFLPYVEPEDLSNQELQSNYKNNLIDKFKKLESDTTKKLGVNKEFRGQDLTITEKDFDNKKDFDQYKKYKEGNPLENLSEDELAIYDAERKAEYVKQRGAKYASNLNKSDRLALQALQADDIENIKLSAESFKNLSTKYDGQLSSYENSLAAYEANPTLLTFKAAENNFQNLLATQNSLQDLQNKVEKENLEEKASIIPITIQEFNKNYNRMLQLRSNFKNLGTSISYPLAQLSMMGVKNYDEAIEETFGVVSTYQEMQEELASYQTTIGVDEIKDLDDAGRWVASSTTNLIPSLAMATTGSAALPLFFLSGAGGSGLDLAVRKKDAAERIISNRSRLESGEVTDSFEINAIEQEIAEDTKTLGISTLRGVTNQALAGIAEVAFERIGTIAILKGIKQGIKGLPKETIKDGFKFAGKQLLKGSAQEGASELGTTLVQNWGDIYILGEDKNIFEGGLESFAQGALMGAGLGSVNGFKAVSQGIASEAATKEEIRNSKEVLDKLRKLTGRPEIQSPDDIKLMNLDLSPEIQSMVDQLTGEANNVTNGIFERISSGDLSLEQLYQVGEVNRKMRKINNRLMNASMSNATPAQLKAFKSQLESEYNQLANEREAILTNESTLAKNRKQINETAVAFESQQGYAMYDATMRMQNATNIAKEYSNLSEKSKQIGYDTALEDLITEGVEAPTIEQIKEKAFENYNVEINTELINKGEKNAKAFAEANGLNLNIQVFEGSLEERKAALVEAYLANRATSEFDGTPISQEQLNSDLKSFQNKIDSGEFEAVNVGGTILVDKTNSIKKGRVGVFAHEVLHSYAAEKFGSKNVNQAGEALINYLKRYDPDFSALIEERIGIYEGRSDYFEEAMNAMSDLLADGVGVTEATTDRLRGFVNNLLKPLGSKFQFKTNQGADVLRFIKNYNAQAHFGKEGTAEDTVGGDFTGESFSRSRLNELARDYKKGKIQADNAELIKQYKRLALSGPGLNFQGYKSREASQQGLKAIKKEDAESFVMEYLPGLLQRYNPENAFSTLVIANINPKRQKFYQEEIGDEDVTTRMSDERVGEIADEGPAPFETVAEADADFKLVDSIKIDGQPLSKETKDKIREFVTEQTQGKDPFNDKFRKEVLKPDTAFVNFIKQEILGGRSLQDYRQFIRQNPKFIKGLGIGSLVRFDTGLTKQGKPKLFTEFNRRLTKQKEIEKFMMQGRVAYVTPQQMKAGADLYNRLKPTETQLANFLTGGTAQTVSNRKTAIAKAIATKFIAEATPSTQAFQSKPLAEQAKMAEKLQVSPTAKFAISKRAKFDKETLVKVTEARDINKVLKILGLESASINDENRAIVQQAFKEAIEKYKLTPRVFLAGSFGSSGAQNTRRSNGDVYYKLTNGQEIKGVPRLDSEGNQKRNINGKKLFNPPTAKQVQDKFVEEVSLVAARGRLYYGVKDPAYIAALKSAENNLDNKKEDKAKRIPIKLVDTAKGRDQAKTNMLVLEDVINQLDKAVKAGMPVELASMVIAQGYQATTGLIKIAAPFRYFSKNLQYGTSAKQKTGDKFREEHNPPASVVGASIIYGFATNNTSEIIADIKKNYYQTKLSKADDQRLDDARLDATLPTGTTIADNSAIRFIEAGIDLNSIVNYETGQTMAEELGVVLKPSDVNPDTIFDQNEILKTVLDGTITAKAGQDLLNEIAKLKSVPQASNKNNKENSVISYSISKPNPEVLNNLDNADKAMTNARNPEAPVKKIRVFDFDDTLARSNSKVLYEMPDGTEGSLSATQFAERAGELESQGATFDFAEFSKVVDGKKGPVFKAIENIVEARGAEDVFILTARPADAAGPIKEFMDALGVNLPIENIVGLGNGTPQAKARWMTSKAAEGYNDFFFVDDAYKNVKAVQDALDVFDVKSKTQQAKVKFSISKDLDKGFNDILENKTGIASEKEYGRVKAEVAGAGKGRLNFFIPPSAEDFVGLLYATLGKGKLGDQQMAWYKTHLLNPYARAMNELSSARIAMMNDYKQLKKQLEIVPKDLRKKVPGEPFTREQAVRVYIWNKQGMSIPGISKKDQADLSKYVSDNAELQVFADRLIAIQKGDQYAAPKEGWPAGTITTDMLEGLNTIKRAKYLEQWQQNADVIFSEKNLNKLEAAYGKPYRLAMENMLQRMKSGRNRNFQGDTLTGRFTDWVTGSIGTIMFFNTRSALLQTISSINFVNFTDNNVLAAGKAFANQKQFWSDFMTLMNSDFLKERRGGLRINVSEADIADMAKKGGAKGVINKLLEFGFTPTQIADSFAIASGGSAFYRNRIKTYKKQGMTDAEAEAQAFVDFRETAEESQQSSRPDRISMQQAGPLGRLVLAFANTPAQYARLIKKAASDLKNGRGDAKTNISKIIYYGVAQNLLFNALQQALFAFAFDDDEEDTEEQQKKYVGIANGMMDSLLRGMGLGGAVVSVGKNAIIRIINEMEKKQPKLEKVGYEITKLSPPISAKLSRVNQAARSYQWDKKEMKEKGWSLDNPAYLASANVIAALTNIPLDRAVKKTNNVVQATSQDLETWERLALLGGWQDWEIGIEEEKPANKPSTRKTRQRRKQKR